jgi:hypothetical protein
LDYWSRLGLFNGTSGHGSGHQRDFAPHQVILVRALVLVGRLCHPRFHRFRYVEPQILRMWEIDPTMEGRWLVLDEEMATVLPAMGLPVSAQAGIIVDLHACAECLRDDDDDHELTA